MKKTLNDKIEQEVLKELKDEKRVKNLNPEGMYFFKPALHIDATHDRIYVSIPIPLPQIIKGQPIMNTQTMVISQNGSFLLDEEELRSKGLFPLNMPTLPLPTRWEMKDIQEFTESVDSVDSEPHVSAGKFNYDTFCTIKEVLEYFLDLPASEEFSLYALWIMMTQVYVVFNEIPFINLTGFSGSGKSKVLTIFQQLCFNAESTNNCSPAALYHSVEQNMSVILIDEGEKLTGIEKEPDLRLLLNACYKKGGSVMRWNPDTKKIERNYTYVPAAIAAINPLEPTLLSRCISRIILKTMNLTIGNRKITNRSYDWQELRNRLYRFIFTASEEIEEIYNTGDFGILHCRNLEKWQSLLSIAKYLDKYGGGKKIYEDIKKLAEEEQDEESALTEVEEITLNSLIIIVKIGKEYFIKDIKEKMKQIFSEEGNVKIIEDINNKAIASILRKFGFRAGKRQNTGIPYRINRDQVISLFKRYNLVLPTDAPSSPSTPIEATDAF